MSYDDGIKAAITRHVYSLLFSKLNNNISNKFIYFNNPWII